MRHTETKWDQSNIIYSNGKKKKHKEKENAMLAPGRLLFSTLPLFICTVLVLALPALELT